MSNFTKFCLHMYSVLEELTHGQEGEDAVDLVELEPEGEHDAEGGPEAEDDGEDSGDGEVGPVADPAEAADDEHGVGKHEDVADGQLVVGLAHPLGHAVAEAEREPNT